MSANPAKSSEALQGTCFVTVVIFEPPDFDAVFLPDFFFPDPGGGFFDATFFLSVT